jgi:hypothetical protein
LAELEQLVTAQPSHEESSAGNVDDLPLGLKGFERLSNRYHARLKLECHLLLRYLVTRSKIAGDKSPAEFGQNRLLSTSRPAVCSWWLCCVHEVSLCRAG